MTLACTRRGKYRIGSFKKMNEFTEKLSKVGFIEGCEIEVTDIDSKSMIVSLKNSDFILCKEIAGLIEVEKI